MKKNARCAFTNFLFDMLLLCRVSVRMVVPLLQYPPIKLHSVYILDYRNLEIWNVRTPSDRGHYATSRKVASSIANGFFGFF
jgi:hypothetical protein